MGSVTITATKAGGSDYKDAAATVTFTTGKKPVTAAVTAADKPYDSTTTADVTASVNSGDLVSGDSITISGLAGTFSDANAGQGKTMTVDSSNATVTGTNADKYTITYPNATASISKSNAVIAAAPSAMELAYTGAPQALVTAGSANVGSVVYSLTETGTYSAVIPTGTDAGDYTVWYKVEGTDNYNGTEPAKVDVKISKADYSGAKTAGTSTKCGDTEAYNLSALLPDGAAAGTAAASGDIFDGNPAVSGNTLTYTLKADAEVDSTGTITIPVISANYNNFELTITVTVDDRSVPELTVNPITVSLVRMS